MMVLSIIDCPQSLRGDLSKWLCEINAGVYVGNPGARVRDALWDRVCKNVKNGRATLVYSTNNEQGYTFRVHNTDWVPVDYDGITFIMRPGNNKEHQKKKESLKRGFSNAAKYRMKYNQSSRQNNKKRISVIDLETTGLDPLKHDILEIGVIRIENDVIVRRESFLIRQTKKIPSNIKDLTGLTDKDIDNGIELKPALQMFSEIVKGTVVYGYNINFDCSFLQQAYKENDMEYPISRTKDVLAEVRKKIDKVSNYKLKTIAEYYSLEVSELHRALPDCELTFRILNKLNEK